MEANASGAYLDSTHEVADKVEAFFVQLAGKGGLIGGAIGGRSRSRRKRIAARLREQRKRAQEGVSRSAG